MNNAENAPGAQLKAKLDAAPDYKEIAEKALFHLRVLTGSRNSFTPEVTQRLHADPDFTAPLRTPAVERMQMEAYTWYARHKHLIPDGE